MEQYPNSAPRPDGFSEPGGAPYPGQGQNPFPWPEAQGRPTQVPPAYTGQMPYPPQGQPFYPPQQPPYWACPNGQPYAPPPPDPARAAENQKQARRDFSRVGLSLLVMGAVTTVLQLVLALAGALVWPATQPEWLLWFLTFVPQYLVAMPLAGWMLHMLVPADRLEQHAIRPGSFAVAALMCIGLMIAGSLIGSGLAAVFSGGTAENPLAEYVSRVSVLQVFIMVILGPIAEEFIFRKLLIDRLARYGGLPAVLASGLCFGLYHMNLFQFFYAAALGMLFAYIYLRTGRLRYPIALHILVNFLGSVVSPLLLRLTETAALEHGNPLAQIEQWHWFMLLALYELLLLGAAIAGIVLLICMRKRFTFPPAACQLSGGSRSAAVLNAGMILFGIFCISLTVYTLLA